MKSGKRRDDNRQVDVLVAAAEKQSSVLIAVLMKPAKNAIRFGTLK